MGHLPRKTLQSVSNSSSMITNQFFNFVGGHTIDVAEWSFEPKKTSKSSREDSLSSIGPVMFRTWDFVGLHVNTFFLNFFLF